ncbi:MAG: hypothetical protein R2880_01040 [Deinococcales bacterium]
MSNSKARQFVDASILAYAFDVSMGDKHKQAKSLLSYLWHSRQGALSLGVLENLAQILAEKANPSLNVLELSSLIQDFSHWRIYRPVASDISSALELGKRQQLNFAEAYLLQAAKQLGCQIFWSETIPTGLRESLEVRSLQSLEVS